MAKDAVYQRALEKIRQAKQISATELNLDGMKLTELPPEIAQLTNLQNLVLRSNQLTALPEVITQLSNLRTLALSGNQLTELPPEIVQLTNLQRLDLSRNQLTTLPEVITQLSNLQILAFIGNQLTTLPEVIAQLSNLRTLALSGNQLTTLPEGITQLSNLQALYLSFNQLTTLPEVITQLSNLQTLVLRGNQLTALPEAITQLTNLQRLDLSRNQLTALPEVITQLSSLQTLVLSRNQLTALPEAITQLTNLQRLDLSRNQLTTLPEVIASLKQLRRLVLQDNRLPIPEEIIYKGWGKSKLSDGNPRAIIDYYLDYLTQGRQPLNEVKMILVGQGTVGKTSLVKRLCKEEFDPSETKTDGIVIRDIKLNLSPQSHHNHIVQLNIWDFGGQEIMHATHQFFLTNRSVYLLLINNRNSEEENRLEYWLNTIESFASNSPVIIVGNKSDEHPLDLNEKDLKQKYPNIKAFISISCKENTCIEELLQKICHEIKALPHVGDFLPKHWFDVKERLENLNKNYIPYEEYADICSENSITEDDKQKSLVSLLHDLGIVLNFHDDPNVNDTHVINPEWLTAGIYRIINYSDLTTKFKGILSFDLLAKILPNNDYPAHKHKFIIAMMKKFELCLDLNGDDLLIPNLLPKSAPESLDETQWQDSLRFEYHYLILSQSIISRFIVKMHDYIANKIWWRTGVVLSDGKNQALVKADLYDKKIFIAINGTAHTRRDFLAAIRSCFNSINKTFSEKSQPEEKIPLPNNPKIAVSYQHLLTLECKGFEDFIPEGAEDPVSVFELLSSIKPIPSDQENFDRIRGDMHFHGETIVNMSDIQQSGNFGIGHMSDGTLKDNAKAVGQYNEASSQNLAQAAQDIKALIDQLEGDYASTPMGNMQMGTEIVTRIDQNQTIKGRVVNALKEAGVETFKQAISHPVAAIVIAGVEGFLEAD
ncbi:COR domain-containing protein [Picosynechococcus sp. PCC 7117]|uniref:COR domain-containing protein n=1 Tax=Picosynechococcus sp. PCC 7117 TaxID=195498 RepID=UPI0018DD7222|nr:COR domain-containing protein [Picosynechococcus sp. PCC 7117]